MRKLVAILTLGIFLASQGVCQASSTVDALIQKLTEKGILTDKEATQLKGQIAYEEQGAAEAGFKKQAPDWLSNIKFSGDFRLRDQVQRRKTPGTGNLVQNRGRFRARLNVEDQINDKLKLVFGLATEGGKDAGTLANNRSNNVTFGGNGGTNSGSFAKPYIAINRAFAVYTPNQYITVMGGKMDNPIWEPASLLMDPDLTPEGGAIQLQKKLNDYMTPFSTNAFFVLKDNTPSTSATSTKTDPYMFISQEGLKGNLTEKVYYKAAGSWWYINNPNHFPLDNRSSVTTNSMSTTSGLTSTYSYNYNLIGGGIDVGMNDPFGELLPAPIYISQIGMFGQYFKNLDPSKQSAAWMAGGYMGNSSINGWGTWKLQTFYKVLQRDSWVDALPDDDFYSGATDTAGWRSQLDFGLAKNTWLTVSYFNTHVYKPNSAVASSFAEKAPESLIQADLNFKF